MGIISRSLGLTNAVPVPVPPYQATAGGTPQSSYDNFARAYASNEIVYRCIDVLASSAAEPAITGRRLRRDKATVRAMTTRLTERGLSRHDVTAWLIENKYVEEIPDHPAVRILNKPNPFMSRGQLWSTVVMDQQLAGNAYLLKARGRSLNNVVELWRLRPDRVKVIPSGPNFIEAYEYRAGGEAIRIPREDVIHFRDRNPMNDYYGMPKLLTIGGRLDIDNYMRNFLRTFFSSGGAGPGSILAVKQRVSQESKDLIRDRFKRQFGGNTGFHELMVLDQADATYTPLGLNRGLRDALPADINAVNESRISMIFGVPPSILGLLVGLESSSYANKRMDWQFFWKVTMVPLLSDLDDTLNLAYLPDFGNIDEVYFDLDDIEALQPDVDAVHERERKNLQAGGITWEEFRDSVGRNPATKEGTLLVPANFDAVRLEQFFGDKEAVPGEVQAQALNGAQIKSLLEILTAVTDGMLSPDSAKDMLRASFPSLSDELINGMIDSAAEFEPEQLPAPAAPPQLPPAEPEEEMTMAVARCQNTFDLRPCHRLLARNVTDAVLDCPRCKGVTIIANGRFDKAPIAR